MMRVLLQMKRPANRLIRFPEPLPSSENQVNRILNHMIRFSNHMIRIVIHMMRSLNHMI